MVSRRIGMLLAGTCLVAGGCGQTLERVAPNWFPPDGSRPGATQRAAVIAAAAARPTVVAPTMPPDAEPEPEADSAPEVEVDPASAPEPSPPPPPPRAVIDAATVTGFTVRELEAGEGLVVGPESRVRMTFTARIVGGEEFQRVDEPVGPWPVAELIPGLAQGLAGMAAGGRRVITIPPDLGYEDTPVTDEATGAVLIPAGSTLSYEVTLVAIDGGVEPPAEPKPEPEPERAAEDADAPDAPDAPDAAADAPDAPDAAADETPTAPEPAPATPEPTPATTPGGGMTR